MTDEQLLFEIRKRISRSKAKRVSYKSLETSKTLVCSFDQLSRVVSGALYDEKLRTVDGYLYEPAPAPALGIPLPPQKKTKAQLKKEAPLPGQRSFGSDD